MGEFFKRERSCIFLFFKYRLYYKNKIIYKYKVSDVVPTDRARPSDFGSHPLSHYSVEGVVLADNGFPPVVSDVVHTDRARPSDFGSQPLSHHSVEGEVLADNGFPPIVSDVVPTDSSFLPTICGGVPAVSGYPPQASGEVRVGPSVQCAYKASTVSPHRVEPGAVRVGPFAAAPGVQKTDMSVFTDASIMDEPRC